MNGVGAGGKRILGELNRQTCRQITRETPGSPNQAEVSWGQQDPCVTRGNGGPALPGSAEPQEGDCPSRSPAASGGTLVSEGSPVVMPARHPKVCAGPSWPACPEVGAGTAEMRGPEPAGSGLPQAGPRAPPPRGVPPGTRAAPPASRSLRLTLHSRRLHSLPARPGQQTREEERERTASRVGCAHAPARPGRKRSRARTSLCLKGVLSSGGSESSSLGDPSGQ